MNQETAFARAGLDECWVQRFMAAMERRHVNLHSVLMARHGQVFFEKYWAPFGPEQPHRLYSITKSFMAVAIGCLIDEGKLRLTDCICDFFPDKLPPVVSPLLQAQTIEDMLTMRTCISEGGWFRPDVTDRLKFYFSRAVTKPAGTLFWYDSTGSYVLGCLVERLSGMSMLDYLRKKVLNALGGFESAQLLRTMDGTPWADSGLLCTPRALLKFAQFVMQEGCWEGRQLVSQAYMRAAVQPRTDNCLDGGERYDAYGYGYQIWRAFKNGFSFNGMGGQFAVCVPEKDFVFVCTADDQLTSTVDSGIIFDTLFAEIVEHLDGESPDEGFDLAAPLSLSVARGKKQSAFEAEINGATFLLDENPMGIRWLRLSWDAHRLGCLTYENAQGEKQLPFGMGENWFGPFPQAGYSNDRGNEHLLTDFRYRCAASAGWVEERKLQIRVQVIDRYLGLLVITPGFRPDGLLGVFMNKCAEDFFQEYSGWAIGRKKAPCP